MISACSPHAMSAPASGNHYRFWLKLNFRGPPRTFEAGRFLLQYPQGVAALNMNLRFENGYKNHLATGYAGGGTHDNVKPPKPSAILTLPTPLHSWPRPHIGARVPFPMFHRRHRRRLCGRWRDPGKWINRDIPPIIMIYDVAPRGANGFPVN